MTRRDERKAENRAKLLAAARKVFSEKGLGAATARDIIRETDLASGTFYNYFDDKEDALRAVMEEFGTQARAAAREERQQSGVDVEERLYRAYLSYFDLVVADPQMFELLRRNADAIAMLGADDLFEAGIRELEEDMGEWVAKGELPAGVGDWLPYVARSIAGGAFQMAARLTEEGKADPEATARFCTELLLDGLRGLRSPSG
jgi:AcrR family transcriptional regulator